MSNTLWLTDTVSACNNYGAEQRFKVTVYFPDLAPEFHDHVIDIVFNDGVIVLVLEDECVYYRAKHVKKWTAVKEE